MAFTSSPARSPSGPAAGGDDALKAFDTWATMRGMRGKDMADTVAKVMRYWVSFAMAKVPRGDAAKVRAGLMRTISGYSAITRQVYSGNRNRDTRRANALRGTMAAAIVAIIDYKGARALAKARSPQFYAVVAEYIGKRAYSANHHRGGFMPAINLLGRGKGSDPAGGAAGVRAPKYAHPPGLMASQFTDQLAEILVENFASQSGNHPFRNRPDMWDGPAGGAFDDALPEVLKMVADFLYKDLTDSARAAGFGVKV